MAQGLIFATLRQWWSELDIFLKNLYGWVLDCQDVCTVSLWTFLAAALAGCRGADLEGDRAPTAVTLLLNRLFLGEGYVRM